MLEPTGTAPVVKGEPSSLSQPYNAPAMTQGTLPPAAALIQNSSLAHLDWDPGSARFSGMGVHTPSGLAANQAFMSSPGWDTGNLIKTTRVITIMDRQLLISDDGEPASLYALCRKWVQNDPELETQSIPEPAALSLPPPPPLDPTPAPPPPIFPDEVENCEAEESLRRLKDHWVAVRLHHQAQARQRSESQRHRLMTLLQGLPGQQLGQQGQQGQQAPPAGINPATAAAAAAAAAAVTVPAPAAAAAFAPAMNGAAGAGAAGSVSIPGATEFASMLGQAGAGGQLHPTCEELDGGMGATDAAKALAAVQMMQEFTYQQA